MSDEPPSHRSEIPEVRESLEAKFEIIDERLQTLERQQQQTDKPLQFGASNLVFVIMSFNPEMEVIFNAIRGAARSRQLTAQRVKDIPGDYRITDEIINMIRTSRFVVADLTYERPNVYFEAGYARGLGKPVITIARDGTKIHFDVYDWVCDFYYDSVPLRKTLSKRFAEQLKLEKTRPRS